MQEVCVVPVASQDKIMLARNSETGANPPQLAIGLRASDADTKAKWEPDVGSIVQCRVAPLGGRSFRRGDHWVPITEP